ncbi:MAG: DsrE family protein [Actinobacteria bacterium]|nr:DsrE family protein [Actinomycetota bacterium]
MKIKSFFLFVLLFALGTALQTLSFAQVENAKKDKSKLLILWTSGDRDVALKVCFMYTHAAAKQKWFDRVRLVVWGPSSRLLANDAELEQKIKAMKKDGVELFACVVCADSYGVSGKLRELGITVIGMGKPLTEMLKSGWTTLTF